MKNLMKTLPGQCQNSKREIEELIRQADADCEQRMRGTPRATYNDELQDHIQRLANEAFERIQKQGGPRHRPSVSARPAGKRKRLADVDDDAFIRGLTQPITLELDDEGSGTGRRLSDIDDATFIKSITEPVTMDLD